MKRLLSGLLIMACGMGVYGMLGSEGQQAVEMGMTQGVECGLDSLPIDSLFELARRGDEQAYRALGDIYRYGLRGTEKSIVNSMTFYLLEGRDIERMYGEISRENPEDEFGLFFSILDSLDSKHPKRVSAMLDRIKHPDSPWIGELKWILSSKRDENLEKKLKAHLKEKRTADELMIDAVALTAMFDGNESKRLIMDNDLASSIPYLYNLAGETYFEQYLDSDKKDIESLRKSLKLLRKAYDRGVLAPEISKKIIMSEDCEDSTFKEYFGTRDVENLMRQFERYESSRKHSYRYEVENDTVVEVEVVDFE